MMCKLFIGKRTLMVITRGEECTFRKEKASVPIFGTRF